MEFSGNEGQDEWLDTEPQKRNENHKNNMNGNSRAKNTVSGKVFQMQYVRH